ncbi:hypothetical protein AGMMS49959_09150 [Planctomycetales bacterium]|nr:hypothetical protein AGMMS49959_09150 [Planctomycetales bacterium]
MPTTTMTLKIDPTIKADAEAVFADLGMTASQAVAVFFRQVALQSGIPFPLIKPKFNAETRTAIEDARLGRNLSGPFATTEEMFASIFAEDANG